MLTIQLTKVPCLTIYQSPTAIEELAIAHPETAGMFVAQHPEAIERFTMLDAMLAMDFMQLQSGWVGQGGELWITDMNRPIGGPNGQIETYRVKTLERVRRGLSALAKRPGWSMHTAWAFDFVMERLGPGKTLREFLNYAHSLGWASKEAWHLQKLPGWADAGDSEGFLRALVARELPLSLEGIRGRLQELGYDAETNMLEAVRAFQTDFGLVVDGDPGQRTQMSLVLGTIKTEVV